MEEKTTALLILDMQTAIVSRYPQQEVVTENMNSAIGKARNAGIPVIFVTVGFRPGMPEISPDNKMFYATKLRSGGNSPAEAMRLHPALALEDGDLVVTKHRVSAFSGSDLEMILRSMGIGHLVIGGIATSGVVLSTVREAADKDFVLTVLSDCCQDSDAEVHDLLISKVFPAQAAVVTQQQWAARSK